MINKIVGYSGFKSYSELDYPTLKQGKDLQLKNKVWEATKRDVDQQKVLDNYHNHKTIYKKSYLENTYPDNYHPDHVPKGGRTTLNFQNAASIKAYDKQEALKAAGMQGATGLQGTQGVTQGYLSTNHGGIGVQASSGPQGYTGSQGMNQADRQLLRSGTEHWKSNYKQEMIPKDLQGQSNFGRKTFTRTQGKKWGDETGNQAGNKDGNNAANQRSNSTGAAFNKTMGPGGITDGVNGANLSYKNRAYINNCRTGSTDYRFNYGEKIGDSPFDLLNGVSYKQPLRDNPLKRGTNQLWTQIPGYQGFKPSQLNFKEYKQKIDHRTTVNKGDLKLNLVDSYHVNTPGYAGFKPKHTNPSTVPRQSCFDFK